MDQEDRKGCKENEVSMERTARKESKVFLVHKVRKVFKAPKVI